MTNNGKVIKPKVKMYGLVRDANGRPVIEGEPNNLHPAIKSELTVDEREALGVTFTKEEIEMLTKGGVSV